MAIAKTSFCKVCYKTRKQAESNKHIVLSPRKQLSRDCFAQSIDNIVQPLENSSNELSCKQCFLNGGCSFQIPHL